MEKVIGKQNFYSPILFVLFGLALVLFAYLLAGGQDRLMPMYGFPEPAYGCNFNDIGVGSTTPLPELSRAYREFELLWCYPPQYYPFYALAILGATICGWALVIGGKAIFQNKPHGKENLFDGISTLIVSSIMIAVGVRIFKLGEIVIFGSGDEPPDIFNSLSLVLVIAGLLVGAIGIGLCIFGVAKMIRSM